MMIKYKIRDVSFSCNEETGECRIVGAGEDFVINNPIEAFNSFWGRVGYILLNEVRTAIKKNGFDQYTGVKNGKENVTRNS